MERIFARFKLSNNSEELVTRCLLLLPDPPDKTMFTRSKSLLASNKMRLHMACLDKSDETYLGIPQRLRSHLLDTKGIAIDAKMLDKKDLTLILASSFLIHKSNVFNYLIFILILKSKNKTNFNKQKKKDHDIIAKHKEIFFSCHQDLDKEMSIEKLNESMRRYFHEVYSLLGFFLDKDEFLAADDSPIAIDMARFLSLIDPQDMQRNSILYQFVNLAQEPFGSCKFCIPIDYRLGIFIFSISAKLTIQAIQID